MRRCDVLRGASGRLLAAGDTAFIGGPLPAVFPRTRELVGGRGDTDSVRRLASFELLRSRRRATTEKVDAPPPSHTPRWPGPARPGDARSELRERCATHGSPREPLR